MKKTGFLLALAAFMIAFSCQKATPTPTAANVPDNAVWRTPNGYVIPYAEKNHWKEYLASELTTEKVDKKHYTSQQCTPEGANSCGLECVETDKRGDCTKASACAPCMNCGCTPTESPY